jgi:hypothetical protein
VSEEVGLLLSLVAFVIGILIGRRWDPPAPRNTRDDPVEPPPL